MALGIDDGAGGTWVNDRGMNLTFSPRILVAQYGDGYSQRLGDGINTNDIKTTIMFNNRTNDDIDDIVTRLETLGGYTATDFTYANTNDGGETTIKVIATSWQKTHSYDDYYSLRVELERVFEP